MSKKSELIDAVWSAVEAAGIGDNALGSLGMASRWIETGKPIKRAVNHGNDKRDDLAEKLVIILQTNEKKDDQKAALAAARARICAPYQDPTMAAYQSARAKAGPVGSVKKSEKMGLQ